MCAVPEPANSCHTGRLSTHFSGCLQSQNQLQGSLPAVTDVPKLSVLDVSRNQLTGALPLWPAGEDLSIMLYNHNRFTGTIPAPPPANQLGTKRRLRQQGITTPTPFAASLGVIVRLHCGLESLHGSVHTHCDLFGVSHAMCVLLNLTVLEGRYKQPSCQTQHQKQSCLLCAGLHCGMLEARVLDCIAAC